MSEQPAASICAGYDADGLPIGLQIVAHRFDDLGVLRLARVYETLRPAQRVWLEPDGLSSGNSGKQGALSEGPVIA
jgi:aspartyl-tRNA(Asn)/glutamyl-tRNA(Gln) amidotransferase subunit A